jgi:hypothetical protein
MKRFESHGKIIYHEDAEDSENEDIRVNIQPQLTQTEEEEEMEVDEAQEEDSSKEINENTGQSIYQEELEIFNLDQILVRESHNISRDHQPDKAEPA